MKKFICCFLSVMLLMGCGIFTSAVSDVQDNTWNKEGYTLVKRETIGLSNDESEVLAENTGNRQIVDCKKSNPANICFDGDDIEFLKSLANQSVLGEKEEEAALTREAIERANLRNELIVDGIIFLLMAELVKWLTRRIVAPVCMGSIPIFRPIYENRRNISTSR